MRERKNHESGNQSRSDTNIVPRPIHHSRRSTMRELMIDFIISLDGYASGEGWPGWWGLEGPEYLSWLEQQPENEYLILMGATTYRLMSGFTAPPGEPGSLEMRDDEAASVNGLAGMPKLVFSSTMQPPYAWPE